MQVVDNLKVTEDLKEIRTAEQGFWDGVAGYGKTLPSLFWKRIIDMTPYERGYVFGYWTCDIGGKPDEEARAESGARDGHGDLGAGNPLAADDCCWLVGGVE